MKDISFFFFFLKINMQGGKWQFTFTKIQIRICLPPNMDFWMQGKLAILQGITYSKEWKGKISSEFMNYFKYFQQVSLFHPLIYSTIFLKL